ncbi:MAG: penicillin acylase family protein, partial [Pseudomonadota bacterium]
PLSPFPNFGLAGASNAWAAAPVRSAAGGTLLANDPHLGFTAPSIWYLARLELSSGGIIGASIPGIPLLLSGRSDTLGWGVTYSFLDDQDIFIERLNPENAGEYLTPSGFRPFRTEVSILDVKDEASVTLSLRWTENGPVLPGSLYDIGSITPEGHVASVAWNMLDPADTSFSAALALNNAQSIDDAIAAMSAYRTPSVNLTLIDEQKIALKVLGRMPLRDARHQSQGRLPTEGWRLENRWHGVAPYADNPIFYNPGGGIVGNTNNKTSNAPFPEHVSFLWGDTQRVQRWERLMQSRKAHTRDSFIEAQLDDVSPTARTLLPLIGADLWFTGEAAPIGTPARKRQEALLLLADWNGEMNEHLPEPLIYAAWVYALQQRLIKDEMGPLADEFTDVEPIFLERVYRDVAGASAWCDVIQSSDQETCLEMAELALDDALLWLDETYSVPVESLRWGDAHEALHPHQVLGQIPVLSWIVNIRQSTSGGDNTLQRGKTLSSGPNPFQNVHGAGYRGVYDLADPDSSVFVLSTGQSGHPLSRHYDDLGALWRRGEYVPMSLDVELARAGSVGTTRLVPVEN